MKTKKKMTDTGALSSLSGRVAGIGKFGIGNRDHLAISDHMDKLIRDSDVNESLIEQITMFEQFLLTD
jgi:hypothetical protein